MEAEAVPIYRFQLPLPQKFTASTASSFRFHIPGFYAEYRNNSPTQAFFHLGIYSAVFQAEVLAISEVTKNLLLEKMHNRSIVVLVDSQAAIKALIKCTVKSIIMLNCIRNLNQLGKQNHVSIAWLPEYAGVHDFMVLKWQTM